MGAESSFDYDSSGAVVALPTVTVPLEPGEGLLAEGHVYKTAAAKLELSVDTIRFHIRNIYEKLHVHSKSEAVLAALRKGLVR